MCPVLQGHFFNDMQSNVLCIIMFALAGYIRLKIPLHCHLIRSEITKQPPEPVAIHYIDFFNLKFSYDINKITTPSFAQNHLGRGSNRFYSDELCN